MNRFRMNLGQRPQSTQRVFSHIHVMSSRRITVAAVINEGASFSSARRTSRRHFFRPIKRSHPENAPQVIGDNFWSTYKLSFGQPYPAACGARGRHDLTVMGRGITFLRDMRRQRDGVRRTSPALAPPAGVGGGGRLASPGRVLLPFPRDPGQDALRLQIPARPSVQGSARRFSSPVSKPLHACAALAASATNRGGT